MNDQNPNNDNNSNTISVKYCGAKRFRRAVIAASEHIKAHETQLNKLNVFPVPDGDTGTNIALTMQSVVKEVENVEDISLETVAKAAAWGALIGARGNSGVIFAQIFAGIAESIDGKQRLYSRDIADVFAVASRKAYKAVIKPSEGTILTVIRETSEAAVKHAQTEEDLVNLLDAMVKQAMLSVQNTPALLPALREAGVVDSGGLGFAYFLEGMLNFTLGKTPDEFATDDEDLPNLEVASGVEFDHDWKHRYCTEFILKGSKISQDIIKKTLTSMGDSIVVVGDSRLARVHIHAVKPEDVLKYAATLGKVSSIKVDDMLKQHTTKFKQSSAKEVSVISVALGDGLKEIFLNMSAELTVDGGQTMNPSVSDIIAAIDAVASTNVIVLPNNRNVLPVTEQAAKLSGKSVKIIPTSTIPEGIAALLAYNEDASFDDNFSAMESASKQVKSGEVTTAVRAATLNGIRIEEGDIIAVHGKEVVCATKSAGDTVLKLLDTMLTDSAEIVTLFFGETVPQTEAEALRADVERRFPGKHIEVHYGGQPYALYIISVE